MPQKAINFFSHNVNYQVKDKRILRHWIEQTIINEGKRVEEINIIICDDTFLLVLNRNYLKHNNYTDVISFNMSEKNKNIQGEIYISIQRIRENAVKFGVTVEEELHRIIIHGVLHLLGYNDGTEKEKTEMREKEDYYLSLR